MPSAQTSSHASTSKKGKAAEEDAAEPAVVPYATPFPFHGTEHVECGRRYRLADKNDCYTFRTFADSLDGFTLRHDVQDEVLVWDKKLSGEPMHLIKVFGVFRATPDNPRGAVPPSVLYDMLQDAVFRVQWDDFRQEAFRIVKMNDNNDVGYYAAKSPVPMVAHRDFVNQRMWHSAGRGEYVIFNTSVPHDAVPRNYQKEHNKNKYGSYVRACSKLTGYLVRPWFDPATGKEDGCCLTYVTQTDPAGWIPTWLTNYITTKHAPNTITNVAKALVQFEDWLPKQMEAGTYEKDWDATPVWWVTEEEEKAHPVANHTVAFARTHWADGGAAKKGKKK